MNSNTTKRRSPSIAELGEPPAWQSLPASRFGNLAGVAMKESPAGPLIDQDAVCKRLRVSRITLWRMVKRGSFPATVDTGKRRAVWRALDVNEWCKAHASHFERVIARRLPVDQ